MLLRTYIKNEWAHVLSCFIINLLTGCYFQAEVCDLPSRYEDTISQDYIYGPYHVTNEESYRRRGLYCLWVDYRRPQTYASNYEA